MKKTICFALSLIIILMMCACSSKSQSPVATPAPSQEVMAEPISEESCEMVRDALPYYAYAEFDTDENGVVKVDVKVDSDDLPHYGDLIFRTLYTAENVFPKYRANIRFWTGKDIPISYMGTLSSGTLNDSRSGSLKMTSIKSANDLTEQFPALQFLLNAVDNGVSFEEYDKYNYITDKLNDMSRTEAEILEELAPEYNMTGEELSAWIYEIMEKIY